MSPPLLEYAESLLISDSEDMDLRSFKLVDQLSGRTLAVRADITPQVARIDGHLLNRQGVARLCYAGSVLHTQPAGLMRTREPLQIGAELYGHAGVESDLEVQRLMLQALALLGIKGVHLDLGHVAVFRSLMQRAAVPCELESELFNALQRKDVPSLQTLAAGLPEQTQAALLALPRLYGGVEVIAQARAILPDFPGLKSALDDLAKAAEYLGGAAGSIGIDLAELRGYHYHSGMVFAAYHEGSHDAIAVGGRYDDVSKAFGRARPATGFSMDLRQLHGLLAKQAQAKGIHAPHRQDAALDAAIAKLGEQGEVVVVDLLGKAGLPHSPANNIKEICEDPHIAYRKMLVEVDQPRVGKIKIVGSPIRLSETPGEVYAPAPLLGEHSEMVLKDILGYTKAEIELLKTENVINSRSLNPIPQLNLSNIAP